MLRRIIPTAERTVTRGGNKTIDKGDAIRERLSLGKGFFDVLPWSVRPCVRPVDAAHMAAGHNAFR